MTAKSIRIYGAYIKCGKMRNEKKIKQFNKITLRLLYLYENKIKDLDTI